MISDACHRHSNTTRSAKAAWRRALVAEDVSLVDALTENPDCLAQTTLLEIVRMGRRWGRSRAADLNAHAVVAGINLAVVRSAATGATIEWLVRALAGEVAQLEEAEVERQKTKAAAVQEARGQRDRWRRRAEKLDRAIARHQGAVQGTPPDAQIAGADEKLWEARERVRVSDGETVEARELRFVRLWNAGTNLTNLPFSRQMTAHAHAARLRDKGYQLVERD